MKKDYWIYKVFLLTFILALIFSGVFNSINHSLNKGMIILIIIIIMIIGILFDIMGVAVLTSKKATFHARASKKIKGAKESIMLIENSTKVASICNDIIGDICGIISGSLGAIFVLEISNEYSINLLLTSIIITALISSLTVGGKAIGKKIAIKECDEITFMIGKALGFLRIK